jgi:neutral ceramidase
MDYLCHFYRTIILKKTFITLIWIFSTILLALVCIGISTLKIIDDRPVSDYPEVADTYTNLEALNLITTSGQGMLQAGWAAENITPEQAIDMAGYGPRGPYNSVRDSLFARVILFDNGDAKAVMISLDLLMFPRILKNQIEEELGKQGFSKEQIYMTATHTHHGFGNWEKSMAGAFAFGKFNNGNMARMLSKICSAIQIAQASKDHVKMAFQKIDAHTLVENRLAPESGTKDPYLRVVHLKKNGGDRAMLISFSGHATNLDADNWELSRDYPGILIDELEQTGASDFVMFAAGMVGSHNIDIDIPKGDERIGKTGERLAAKILENTIDISYDSASVIGGIDIEIALPESQLRLGGKIGVRDWVFRTLFGPLKANIKLLQIGDVLFIGMPCDYSGELSINNQLDAYAAAKGKDLFISSFNGNYVGYITEDSHYYTCDHDEVKTMNWVGPNMGAYFTESIKKLINTAE